MARRYGQTPARWVGRPSDGPVLSLWLDLLMSRIGAAHAVGTLEQFLKRNGESVMWVAPVPGT